MQNRVGDGLYPLATLLFLAEAAIGAAITVLFRQFATPFQFLRLGIVFSRHQLQRILRARSTRVPGLWVADQGVITRSKAHTAFWSAWWHNILCAVGRSVASRNSLLCIPNALLFFITRYILTTGTNAGMMHYE